MFGSVRRTRSHPIGAMKRPPLVPFSGFGFQHPTAFCGSVYTPALLATIVLSRIGILAMHKNSPGIRRGSVLRRGVLRNDRSPFWDVQVNYTGPSVPCPHRPVLSGHGRPNLSAFIVVYLLHILFPTDRRRLITYKTSVQGFPVLQVRKSRPILQKYVVRTYRADIRKPA